MSTLCIRVFTTPVLCSNGWLLLKFKYWSIWVSLWYTLVLIEPSSLIKDQVSKKASALSVLVLIFTSSLLTVYVVTSPSVVHTISSSMLFRWSVNKDRVCFIYIQFQPAWLVCSRFQCPSLKTLHIQVTENWRYQRSRGSTMNLKVVLILKRKICTLQ